MKKIICLICCRGGSKNIKDKNIRNFAGKPLLAWILKEAIKSKIFDKIILSTDSKKIAKVGRKYGILIPGLRPRKLALSNSNQFDTHKYIFKKLNINDKNSIVCNLLNNPFINSHLIKKSFKVFKKFDFKRIVVDYTKVDSDYIALKQFSINKNDKIKLLNPKKFLKLKLNRQELKNYYVFIHNIRWGLPSDLIDYEIFKKNLLKNGYGIKLSKLENFDLDDMEDWIIAKNLFKLLKKIKKN